MFSIRYVLYCCIPNQIIFWYLDYNLTDRIFYFFIRPFVLPVSQFQHFFTLHFVFHLNLLNFAIARPTIHILNASWYIFNRCENRKVYQWQNIGPNVLYWMMMYHILINFHRTRTFSIYWCKQSQFSFIFILLLISFSIHFLLLLFIDNAIPHMQPKNHSTIIFSFIRFYGFAIGSII